ncbi:hypothetical protein SO694_00030251 [Aureococcus anophagefferens]|uniref:LamG-like jellyroll fold domain-containing protein n=1 Tax=Aureococcus anophagefferens TaxID=44056 RepID=A0ABR1FK24_AURAN
MYESNKLTGAIDELYVYTSALDREAISVLYGSVTASRRGDTYKNGHARNLGPTESGERAADALGFDGEVYAVLPDALTYEALTGDEERTICLWARIDDWDGGFLFEYGSDSADGASFGLAVGDAESNVTLALSGSYQTVVTIYGNTSYIDWDDWHHYCLTYDGSGRRALLRRPRRGDRPASLDTETMYGLRVGADMYESNKLTGAIDELYVYTSALDREAISVLYGSVTASPAVTPALLPDALTYEALTGDEERTICLWARIDDWDGGFLFEYGSDSAGGASFGLAVGDAESNVTLALSGSYQTVVTIYGNTSYIDWDDWHRYCLTYDGSDVVLYFDGLAEATAPRLSTRRPCTGFEWAPTCTNGRDDLRQHVLHRLGRLAHGGCLTYDGTDLVFYFGGLAGDRPAVGLDTETMYGLKVGSDMTMMNKLTGAIDELYVYTSALDREAISVLYGSVTASRR